MALNPNIARRVAKAEARAAARHTPGAGGTGRLLRRLAIAIGRTAPRGSARRQAARATRKAAAPSGYERLARALGTDASAAEPAPAGEEAAQKPARAKRNAAAILEAERQESGRQGRRTGNSRAWSDDRPKVNAPDPAPATGDRPAVKDSDLPLLTMTEEEAAEAAGASEEKGPDTNDLLARWHYLSIGHDPDTGRPIDKKELEAAHRRAKKMKAQADAEAVQQAEGPAQRPDRDNSEPAAKGPKDKEPSEEQTAADVLQLAADVVGVFDPTGLVDGVNAAVSLGRAYAEPERRGEHLSNAAISAVSIVPYAGDLAKLGKLGRAGRTVKRASKAKQATRRQQALGKLGPIAVGALGGMFGGNQPPVDDDRAPEGPEEDPDRERSDEQRERSEKQRKRQEEREAQREKEDRRSEDRRQHSLMRTAMERTVQGVLTLGAAAFAAAKVLGRLSDKTIEDHRRLKPWSGELAAGYGREEIAQVEIDYRRAQAVDEPTAKLIDEQMEMKNAIEGMKDPFIAMKTMVLAELAEARNDLGKMVAETSGLNAVMAKLSEWLGIDRQENAPEWHAFIQDVADGRFDGLAPVQGEPGNVHELLSAQDQVDVFKPKPRRRRR